MQSLRNWGTRNENTRNWYLKRKEGRKEKRKLTEIKWGEIGGGRGDAFGRLPC
jgi:hypothetical protein